MPDTLVIIFFVAILTSLATWVVPVGLFDSQEVQYQVDGQTKTRKVVDPHSLKRRTKNAKAFHDKCENFSFRASNETAVLITAFYSLHGDHLGYG